MNMSDPLSIQTRAGQEDLKSRGIRPIPKPDEYSAPYWEAAARHKVQIMRCENCEELRHPPTPECPYCGSDHLTWAKLSGHGLVYSFIVDHRLMVPGFDEPYVIVQVTPDEATRNTVRIVGNLRDCELDDVRIGMSVETVFEEVTAGVVLPQFRPRVQEASGVTNG
jgi:uncharacterized OB-fold protein